MLFINLRKRIPNFLRVETKYVKAPKWLKNPKTGDLLLNEQRDRFDITGQIFGTVGGRTPFYVNTAKKLTKELNYKTTTLEKNRKINVEATKSEPKTKIKIPAKKESPPQKAQKTDNKEVKKKQ